MPRRSMPQPERRPFLDGARVVLRRAYPQVAQIEIKTQEAGDVEPEWRRERTFRDDDVPADIPCGNRRCRQGGYDLSNLVLFITTGRVEHDEHTIHCEGHEGSPKGRRRGDPCMNFVRIAVKTVFRTAEPSI